MLDETLKAALDNAGAKLITPAGVDVAAPIASVPDGFDLRSLERFMAQPSRIRAAVTVHRAEDFIAYCDRHSNTSSTIFVDASPALSGDGGELALAVIDYHHGAADLTPDERPEWCSHTVKLKARPSTEYAMLAAIDGKLMAQGDFSRYVRDLSRFCSSHVQADLLELVNTLNLTSRGSFQSSDDYSSGSVRMVFDVQVSASAGTQEKRIAVPNELTWTMPMLLGGAPIDFTTDLIYAVPNEKGGKVQLGLRIRDRAWIEQQVVADTAAMLSKETGLLTLVGCHYGVGDD